MLDLVVAQGGHLVIAHMTISPWKFHSLCSRVPALTMSMFFMLPLTNKRSMARPTHAHSTTLPLFSSMPPIQAYKIGI